MNFIQSIWKMKCPKCRQSDLFVEPFDLKTPVKMHVKCSICGQRFEPEPGYYFGAMFISYVWTGWMCIFIVGFCMLVLDWSIGSSFALLIGVAALSYFWVLRISRSMFIHLDVKFDKKYKLEKMSDRQANT